jgi:hypothetical protein
VNEPTALIVVDVERGFDVRARAAATTPHGKFATVVDADATIGSLR